MSQIQELQEQVLNILDTELLFKYQIAVSLCNYIQIIEKNAQTELLLKKQVLNI